MNSNNSNMETLIKNNLTEASIKDVRAADSFKSLLDNMSGDWIYNVDPETMDQVRSLYKLICIQTGDVSLYKVFCNVLRYAKKHKLEF